MTTVITLPPALVNRSDARATIRPHDADVVLDATSTKRFASAAVDELTRALLRDAPQRVIVVNASGSLERALRLVHRARARPERTFLLTFRQVAAEALLRAV